MARKILLADDSVTAQNMGRRILTDSGYEVITVNNGSAAIKKIAEIKPDIVMLDVYMPGYGGLEICQRIRETPELARIPVLLTVGKLEPFKAEDSLRVRADAFVIKPFEASELLTALTKLEDKIVPSAQPFSGGRFARAIAAVENSAGGAREFGDADTGWKSRLKIPAPYSKPHPSHTEPQPGAVVSEAPPAERVAPPQTGNVASILPDPAVAALPHDVTPEEIAAITAAAALLAGHARSADEPAAEKPSEAAPEPRETEPASAPGWSAEQDLAGSSFAPAPQEPAEAERVETTVQSVPEAMAEVELEGMPSGTAASSDSQPVRPSGDEEVAAALDALLPGARDADPGFPIGEYRSAEVSESVPVTMAAAGVSGELTGPRWIAEEVPVSQEESALVLELEMQRTYAAFAAADAARSIVGDHGVEDFDAPAHEEAAATEEAGSQGSDTPATFEASPQVEAPAIPVEDSSPTIVVADLPPEPVPPVVEASSATVEAEPEEKAAYAVASASGGAAWSVLEANAGPVQEISEVAPAAPEPVPQPHDNELAAAWASWKQVRESVTSPESTSQAVETTTSGFRELRHEPTEPVEPDRAEASEEGAENAEEIASIVDSVLADLKPKLMKEISQKMGKGKRKK